MLTVSILLLSWRVIKNIVVLREWSLHETLAGNGVRLQFPGTLSLFIHRQPRIICFP